MAVEKILGDEDYAETGVSTQTSEEAKKHVVTVEGPYNTVKDLDPEDFVPSGLTLEDSNVETTGDGFARLVVRCTDFGEESSSGTLATRTTWKIEMACVQTDLKYHPTCVGDRLIIEMWLNTDPIKRFNPDNNSPQYVDSTGAVYPVAEEGAQKYIKAYMKGIETYNRYFPILRKISYYKRLPGVSVNKKSTTSGTVSEFSDEIGMWDVPDVHLTGFANTGWFKSGDNYEQDNSLVWTRNEEWTWTPDGSGDEDTGWIYKSSKQSSNQS